MRLNKECENYISDRSHAVDWSGIRKISSLARETTDVANLAIGQPDFCTPDHIIEAAKKALDDGYTRYPPAKGFEDLRCAIAKKLKRVNNIVADPYSEIMISIGAMQGIFNSALHIVNHGDEVIVFDPGYDYYSQIKLFGGKPVCVPVYEMNNFKIDPDDIKKKITNKTKLMIINTPSNPTGAILDERILLEICKIAQRYGILILSDEPYEMIVFNGKKHISIGSLDGMKELAISVFTLSKSYSMTGWRIGYIVANKSIINEMEKLIEHSVSGVTAVSQRAALAAVEGPQDCVLDMVKEYEKRRMIIYKGLNQISGVACLLPEGTFYAFPNISRFGLTSWNLAKYLLKKYKVAVIPGKIFGHRGEGYLRVSFAVDTGTIQDGLIRIKKGLDAIRSMNGEDRLGE
jgi:aspartate/methionine/tyrosine aminotransferase